MKRFVSADYVYGYRDWTQSDGVLVGRWGGSWDGAVETAVCRRQRKHQAPDPECRCGIYAVHASGLWTSWDDPDAVVGFVAASGLVIDGPEGFRAERVAIVALFAFHSHNLLKKKYKVDVLADPFEFMRRTEVLVQRQKGAERWGG